ncbi:MAG: hypothetical protein FWF50_07095 [Defluviitaleaceae bacterium]|nr:hypothetical protein [Defluviitaleaceae bacterium]
MKSKNSGNAYVFVLILMVSLFSMLAFLLRISMSNSIMQVDREPGLRILAQSGIDIGFANAHITNPPTDFIYKNKNLTVHIESTNYNYRIYSTAGNITIYAIMERDVRGTHFIITSVRELLDR